MGKSECRWRQLSEGSSFLWKASAAASAGEPVARRISVPPASPSKASARSRDARVSRATSREGRERMIL
jgi:hypothetical protein